MLRKVDAYMIRRELGALIAVPVMLTNVRTVDADKARAELDAGRITFVSPRVADGIVFADYAPGVAAAWSRACGHDRIAEIRVSEEGIKITQYSVAA